MTGLEAEVEQLRTWKSEALTVLSEWESTWDAANRPGKPGSSKARGVRERIAQLEAEVSRLNEVVAAAHIRHGMATDWGARLQAEVARVRREFEWLHKKAGRTGSRLDAVVRAAHVPHGPEGVPEHVADAAYLREAAHKLDEHYKPFGSNLRATVVALLHAVAAVLDGDEAGRD